MQDIPHDNLHLVSEALRDFPRPDTLALRVLRHWLSQRGVHDSPSDLDVVTLHYQFEPLGEGRAHFQEQAVVTQKLNLVEALLGNWQGETAAGYGGFHHGEWAGTPPLGTVRVVERLEAPDALSNYSDHQVFNGLYRRTQPAVYGPETRLAIRAEEFQGFIWSLHFHHLYKALLDTYWSKRQAAYQRALKINFIAACNRQVEQGSLGEPARELIWQVAGLTPRQASTRVSMLNVYGYTCTSILRLQNADTGLNLLYIPGNRYPFHSFDDGPHLQRWFAEQCRDPARRQALLQCFSPTDWPDGLDFSGVRTALTGLGLYPKAYRLPSDRPGFTTDGTWPPERFVDYRPERYSTPLNGDVFAHLAGWQKRRSYAAADSQIVSNHQVDKANWAHYLDVAIGLLAPVAMVLPALMPLLAAGGLAQFSLGLDQVLNGQTLEAKDTGVSQQLFGLFNAAPWGGQLLARPGAVFRYSTPGFFSSARLGELTGATLGAAPLPEALELQPAEVAFRQPLLTGQTLAQPVVKHVEASLVHRFCARLLTAQGLVRDWVEYELETDSFIRTSEARLPEAPRWITHTEAPDTLVQAPGLPPTATDAARMARLDALGIHLELPVDFERYATLQRTPIPRRISSIWTGNRPLGPEFLDALTHNAKALRTSEYRFQLLLSRQDQAVYQANQALLQAHAPDLDILPLEDQAFFHAFRQSPYFVHYQAALGALPGTVGNFGSACDILRYRLLAAVGGLYLDADDLIVLPKAATQTLPLDRITLATTVDGLLLAPPVSNDQMGLYIQFNNSLIGSHPGNPTLDAISQEMLRRYRLHADFYAARPDPEREPVLFDAYARRLNQLTGPAVLNHVIDQRLPWLGQLREMCQLLVSPVHDVHKRFNLSRFLQVMREHVPLDQVATIGSARSWRHQ